MHTPIINYVLKSEVAITLSFLLRSACYTALQMCRKLLCLNPVATESVGKKAVVCVPIVNHILKNEVAIVATVCPTHYTVLQIIVYEQ